LDKGFNFLSIYLTHQCNLNCDFCAQRVWDSDYEITMEQVERFCTLCNDVPAPFIRISGGEPLAHPNIEDIIDMLVHMRSRVGMFTNGTLLHHHESIIGKLEIIQLTQYEGRNDEAVARYRNLPNVNLIKRPYYDNPHLDPDYTVDEARYLYSKCVFGAITVVGDNVYGCCRGEPIERFIGIPLHVKLKENWVEEYKRLDPLPACQHCVLVKRENG